VLLDFLAVVDNMLPDILEGHIPLTTQALGCHALHHFSRKQVSTETYSWLPAHMAVTCPIFHHSFGAVTANRMTTRVTYFSIDHWTSTAT